MRRRRASKNRSTPEGDLTVSAIKPTSGSATNAVPSGNCTLGS
jgi:hypothetical protein